MSETRVPKYFPYRAPRPGQLALIEAIQEEFSKGNHLCVEAVNGFGKTIASLSAVLPLSEQLNHPSYRVHLYRKFCHLYSEA